MTLSESTSQEKNDSGDPWIKIFWDPEPSTSQDSRSKPWRVKTPIAEFPSSDVDLDSFMIEADLESSSNDPDDCIEIPKDSCVFTLTHIDFENIHGLPLIHPQLIDWNQQEPPQLELFKMMRPLLTILA